VTALYVVPEARQSGLGGALLEEAIGECTRHRLDCAVLWSIPQSRTLYRRYGFATDREILVLRSPGAPDDEDDLPLGPGPQEELQGST